MGWSPTSATNAYLDTLKLCKHEQERRHEENKTVIEPESSEFISALAAGTSAKLIVEVSSEASDSTIALAAAARQTGGKLVCILPKEESLNASKEVIEESGLNDMVDFKVGDPYELLPEYENVDFSLVDCKNQSFKGLLKLLDVNPRRSVVVTSNLVGGREGLGGDVPALKEKGMVRSMMHPIGKGMQVTMIGKSEEFAMLREESSSSNRKRSEYRRRRSRPKSKWVMQVDEESGEEHIYRLPQSL